MTWNRTAILDFLLDESRFPVDPMIKRARKRLLTAGVTVESKHWDKLDSQWLFVKEDPSTYAARDVLRALERLTFDGRYWAYFKGAS